MTREHKLAMIVGFALVLVVGVLVSDHLSGARKARMASVDLAGQEMGAREVDVAFGRKPELPPSVTIARREQTPTVTFDEQNRGVDPSDAERPLDRVVATNTQADDGIHAPETGDIGFGEVNPPAAMATETAKGDLEMGKSRPVPPGFERVVSENGRDTIVPLNGNDRIVLKTENEVVAPIDAVPVKVEKAKTRVVKEGDTLWSIAADVYGDGKLHKKLGEYNKSRLGSGGQLRVGASLLIPDKNVLLGKAQVPATTETAEAKNEKPATSIAAKSEATKKSGKGTYVVKKGDTLAAIAKRELGSAGRWEEILELNSSELDDENSIRAGMTIKLPR